MKWMQWIFLLSALGLSTEASAASMNRSVGILQYSLTEPTLKANAALPLETPIENQSTEGISGEAIDVFYIVGGMRLNLNYQIPALSVEEWKVKRKVYWNFSVPGKICKGYIYSDQADYCEDLNANTDYMTTAVTTPTPGDELHKLYWEPRDWSLGMAVNVKLKIDFDNHVMNVEFNGGRVDVKLADINEHFKIMNRPLKPGDAGSDVKMLEQMLWQLGVSPSGSPGTKATRLADNKRSQYETGNNTVGKMVGRFNYFSHSPINKTTDKQGFIDETLNGIRFATIDELKKHWVHYMQAYYAEDYSMKSKTRFSFSDLLESDKNAAEAVFDGKVNYPRGITVTGIDPTYIEDLHKKVTVYGDFARIDILKAMAQQEASGQHWGDNGDYRVKVGGADEAGSKGFNQIQNKYTYGGLSLDGTGPTEEVTKARNNICVPVSAYTADGKSQVNHYDPGQNLVAKAVWLAGVQGNCGRSFRRAFHDNSYTGTYKSPAGATLLAMTTGSIRENITAGTHIDDTYELLSKAIGAYNQGAGVFNGGNGNAWVSLLVGQITPTSADFQKLKAKKYEDLSKKEKPIYGRTQGMVYGMAVMHDTDKLNLKKRQYIWQGGTYDANLKDAAGNPDPKAGQAWCFGYGEQEWLGGKLFEKVKNGATGSAIKAPVGRVHCETGVPL